jgi:23S rRNA (guanosine2251-2'-O)-methyltransferase
MVPAGRWEMNVAGNSQRRGAMRNPGSKKGAVVGSGGQRRKGLKGKGPTPRAKDRPYHPAAKRERAAAKRASEGARTSSKSTRGDSSTLMGRNAIVEALRAGIPAKALYVQMKSDTDERWREAMKLALHHGIPIMEVTKLELDRMSDGGVHQGLVLSVPPFAYAELSDLKNAHALIALDGVTDPRNLGAIARSAGAFGAGGLVIPSRRSVGVTASAWKASAGALTRVPVAQVTNLTRTLEQLKEDGFIVIGLAGDGGTDLSMMRSDVLSDRIVLVVGSEGSGLSRLVRESCDWLVRIPMLDSTESLNASVAASIAMYAMAQARTTPEAK